VVPYIPRFFGFTAVTRAATIAHTAFTFFRHLNCYLLVATRHALERLSLLHSRDP
jgi:hypothetical protein